MSDLDHAIAAELKGFRLPVARQLARLDGRWIARICASLLSKGGKNSRADCNGRRRRGQQNEKL